LAIYADDVQQARIDAADWTVLANAAKVRQADVRLRRAT
jgi:hypothetical protein